MYVGVGKVMLQDVVAPCCPTQGSRVAYVNALPLLSVLPGLAAVGVGLVRMEQRHHMQFVC
jgi:hypothetical protein